jgi:DUF917 family protein
MESEDRFVE